MAERAAAGTPSTWVGVGVNVCLAVMQLTDGILSKSQGLVAGGIHSLSNLAADFVVLFAGCHAKKDANEDRPYGHQRFETAASLVLGGLPLAVGVGMLWSPFRKLESPETVVQGHVVALWVAGGAPIAKKLLFRYMLAVAKRVKSSMLVANAWHSRSEAASSLVVGLGITGNLAGYPILDPIAALIVGFMVSKMGWSFGWEALHDLMGPSVNEHDIAVEVRQRVLLRYRVLNLTSKCDSATLLDPHGGRSALAGLGALMKHVDPWRRPDLDHAAPVTPGAG